MGCILIVTVYNILRPKAGRFLLIPKEQQRFFEWWPQGMGGPASTCMMVGAFYFHDVPRLGVCVRAGSAFAAKFGLLMAFLTAAVSVIGTMSLFGLCCSHPAG